jgi:hypothetical protein
MNAMRNLVLLITLVIILVTCKQSSNYDSFGGFKGLKAEGSKWFTVGQVDGRWYFITPEGHPFFSIGATHAVECIKLDELDLFTSQYQQDESKLSEVFLSYFKKWGYNSSGYGALPSMEKSIPYVVEVWTYGPRSLSAGERSKHVDIFDPGVKNMIKQVIIDSVARHINNPLCLGYVGIDLPLWVVSPARGESYPDFFRKMDTQSLGKAVYIDFLKKKYANDLSSLNAAYHLQLSSVEDIIHADLGQVSANDNQNIASDDYEFLLIIAEEYFSYISAVFQEADPNHLYLGDRFMAIPDDERPHMKVPDDLLVIAAKYVDVISFQPMGTRMLIKDYIDHVNAVTGLPVLLADVNCVTIRPEEGQEDTYDYEIQTGEHTLEYYLNASESRSLIGIHRCTVRDFRPWDTRYHRRGLLKRDDTPYPILEEFTIKANEMVYELVYGN